ncbi:MAG: glycosyl hydrolase [Verrucomicrobiota bacterium]
MSTGLLSLSPSNSQLPAAETGNQSLSQPQHALLAGAQRGIAYSGFRDGQHPDRGDGAVYPTDDQILEDLRILTEREGFELIRLYDSKQNSEDVLRLIKTRRIPLKVMLGIWLDGEVSNHEGCAWVTEPVPQEELDRNIAGNRAEVKSGIRLANEYPEIVVAVNVGNESLVAWNDHLVTIDSMIAHVREVKESIHQPVTTADNYKVFADYGTKLAKHLDFLAVHSYPQWEGKSIDEALPYTIENLLEIRDALPDVPILIAEAGWASTATEFGERASESLQLRHYQELFAFGQRNNISIFWFEAFDESWKGNPDNPYGAEKHWGLYFIDRAPKLALREKDES